MEEARTILKKLDSYVEICRSLYGKLRNVFILTAANLLSINTMICDYFYFKNGILQNTEWWKLKHSIYALIVALSFQACSFKSSKMSRFLLQVGTGFAIVNVVEIQNNTNLEFKEQILGDFFMIILVASIDSIYKYYKDAI